MEAKDAHIGGRSVGRRWAEEVRVQVGRKPALVGKGHVHKGSRSRSTCARSAVVRHVPTQKDTEPLGTRPACTFVNGPLYGTKKNGSVSRLATQLLSLTTRFQDSFPPDFRTGLPATISAQVRSHTSHIVPLRESFLYVGGCGDGLHTCRHVRRHVRGHGHRNVCRRVHRHEGRPVCRHVCTPRYRHVYRPRPT